MLWWSHLPLAPPGKTSSPGLPDEAELQIVAVEGVPAGDVCQVFDGNRRALFGEIDGQDGPIRINLSLWPSSAGTASEPGSSSICHLMLPARPNWNRLQRSVTAMSAERQSLYQ
jgi:hypothetical protein